MNAGERVTTVKAIADQLMWSDWSDIDLTLEHFGVPTSVWDGEKRPYLIEKLKAAPDGQLQALNSYLSGTDAAPADAAKLPWDQVGLFRLFGSHRAEDKVMVGEVKASL